jgi:hypothetical protein
VPGHSTENYAKLWQKIYKLIAGSIKLNPVENETPKTNDQPKINNVASEEGINFIGDDLTSPNI